MYLAADLLHVVLQPLPVPDRSVGVGSVEGGYQIVFVLVWVLAQKVQAHGIVDEGLHLPRGLEPPAHEQSLGRGTSCRLLRRHTNPCTGTHAPRFESRGL